MIGLLLLLGSFGDPVAASAATPIVRARSASTVTADALPTVQINGVVWTQAMIGNVVYAGGDFTAARPAGAAPGTHQTARRNLLAYDITTGKLIATFAPGAFNGAVKTLAVSSDKKTVYVGGNFTKVGTAARGHFAALDARTGALRSPAPSFNNSVSALVATGSTVYVGGAFTTAGGQPRSRLASMTTGGKITRWAPRANSGVNALVLTDKGRSLVVGGSFTTLNGSPASGSGALDPSTGHSRTWKVNRVVRNGGKSSGVLSLATDGSTVYASAYTYGTGNFEGVYAASGTDGTVRWLQDCHGDAYSVAVAGGVVYSVGHAHYCANIGGFPDTSPRTAWYRALAVSTSAAGTVVKNGQTSVRTYTNFAGQPAPALYNWFPDLAPGTFTGMSQAAWSVVGNGSYVSLGGEFPKVNGVAQQGLVRMAVGSKAPGTVGPQLKGSATVPSATVQADGSVAVSWPENWDRDDLRLTYRLSRNGTVVDTRTLSDPFWNRRTQTFLDTSAGDEGSGKASYTLTVSDPNGNTVTSPEMTVRLPGRQPTPTPTPSTGNTASPSPAATPPAATPSGTTTLRAAAADASTPDASTPVASTPNP